MHIKILLPVILFVLCITFNTQANYPSCGIPGSYYNGGTSTCFLDPSLIVGYTNTTTSLSSLNKVFYKNALDVVVVAYNNISNQAVFGGLNAFGGNGQLDTRHPDWESKRTNSINTMTYYSGVGATTNIYNCGNYGFYCTQGPYDAGCDCYPDYFFYTPLNGPDGAACLGAGGTIQSGSLYPWTGLYTPYLFDVNCNTAVGQWSGLCAGSLTIDAITGNTPLYTCNYIGQVSILNTELTAVCPVGWTSNPITITNAQCQQMFSAWGVFVGLSCTGASQTLLCQQPSAMGCPSGSTLVGGFCSFPPSCPSGGVLTGATCVTPSSCTFPRYPAGWQTPSTVAQGTPIRAADVNIIRNDINLMRLDANLPVCSWADTIATGIPIKATQMNEMRNCIYSVYDTCGFVRPQTSVNTLAVTSTPIQSQHFNDLWSATQNAP